MKSLSGTGGSSSPIARAATRFVLLCVAFFIAGIHLGKVIVFWAMGGEPLWILSMTLFVQAVANAIVGVIIFVLAWPERGPSITPTEKVALVFALIASATSIGLSLVTEVWRGAIDWISLLTGTLLVLYAVWIALRIRSLSLLPSQSSRPRVS